MMRAVLVFVILAITMAGAIDLTPENFDEHVGASKKAVVKFFAPWCGHCKKMAPAWDQLEQEFGSEVTVGSVDCTVHRDLCSKFGVRGYPTLKGFKAGSQDPLEYKGGRDFNTLKGYVVGDELN
ncbi:Protein disulfide-isomerase tigA [Diplonema papillatum]|nr:Protein disulfide-isomerase tigA [Diplonema papillatum]KAJ9441172.1 Protein disulfide-isomerase tigA [Diplonema papillatum]|eukprot:gene12361-19117_t